MKQPNGKLKQGYDIAALPAEVKLLKHINLADACV